MWVRERSPGGYPRIAASVNIFNSCLSFAITALRFDVTPCIELHNQATASHVTDTSLTFYLDEFKQYVWLCT